MFGDVTGAIVERFFLYMKFTVFSLIAALMQSHESLGLKAFFKTEVLQLANVDVNHEKPFGSENLWS